MQNVQKFTPNWIEAQANRLAERGPSGMTPEELRWARAVLDVQHKQRLMTAALEGDQIAIEACVDAGLDFKGTRSTWYSINKRKAILRDASQSAEDYELAKACITAELLHGARHEKDFDSREAVRSLKRLYRTAEREAVVDKLIEARGEYVERAKLAATIKAATGWNPSPQMFYKG